MARRPHHRHIGGQPIGTRAASAAAPALPDKAGRKRCAAASETGTVGGRDEMRAYDGAARAWRGINPDGTPDEGTLARLNSAIVEAVQPVRIVLFGSAAGEMRAKSDLDVLARRRDDSTALGLEARVLSISSSPPRAMSSGTGTRAGTSSRRRYGKDGSCMSALREVLAGPSAPPPPGRGAAVAPTGTGESTASRRTTPPSSPSRVWSSPTAPTSTRGTTSGAPRHHARSR